MTETGPRRVVTSDPENSELPFEAPLAWITPRERFYVRNHFRVPALDPHAYRLKVGDGELSLAALEDLPQRAIVATLECAGNGRRYCDPPADGVQWGTGAVSTTEWGGPALGDVLAAAGAPLDRPHVHLTGADRGRPEGVEREIAYRRSLPRDKALDPDTLVALRLGGEPLAAAHGAPARILVPGWYGMASVKWLVAVEPADSPSEDHFMVRDYTRRTPDGGREPLDWVRPKAEIAHPAEGAGLAAGPIQVSGAAWAGCAAVERVEVTVDGGASWHTAALDGPQTRWGWRLWRWSWDARPGAYRLAARATDGRGEGQPERPDGAAHGYENHWVRFRAVEVR